MTERSSPGSELADRIDHGLSLEENAAFSPPLHREEWKMISAALRAAAQGAPEAPGYRSGLTYGDGYKRGLADARGAPQAAGKKIPDCGDLKDFVNILRAWPAHEGHDALASHYVSELMNDAADFLEALAGTQPQAAPTREQIAAIIREKVDYFLDDEQGPLDAADAILALSRPQRGDHD